MAETHSKYFGSALSNIQNIVSKNEAQQPPPKQQHKNRNNSVAQNQWIVLLDIPYIVIRSLTRFKLAILTAASSWVTDFFMASTSAWYCLVSEFVALTTLAIFSVVGKAHCDPTDRPTCSTAPFHLDFGTANSYVMRLQVTRDSHLFPISSPGQAAKQQTGHREK